MTAQARMTRKGQITIPIAIRKDLGLREGDHLTLHREGRRIVLENASEALRATAGVFARCALPTPPTPSEESEAVEQAIADEFAASLTADAAPRLRR